jgi:uncharacterized protein YndB with AHSA1/START domain
MPEGSASLRFTIQRIVNAPAAAVFRAWTDPNELGWFFNPNAPVSQASPEVDLRVGGVWRQRMIIDDHTQYDTGGIYTEVVEGERLSFRWGAQDGWPNIDLDNPASDAVATVQFNGVLVSSELTFTLTMPSTFSPADARQCEQGWAQTLDRLVERFVCSTEGGTDDLDG